MSDRQKALILLIVLLLIPILLTDPLEWPKRIDEAVAPAPRPQVHDPIVPVKPVAGFQSWNDPSFDREAFLASFRRQSAMGLRDCLVTSGLTERAFSATATLNRKGELRQLRWNNEEPLPNCVIETIRAMNFIAQADHLIRPSIEIQWRVDW